MGHLGRAGERGHAHPRTGDRDDLLVRDQRRRGAGYVGLQPGDVTVDRTGVADALAAGVFAGGGAVAFYAGLERGQTGIVATVSALYFVVAAVLGIVFLGESLEWQDALGIGFAVLSVALLAR